MRRCRSDVSHRIRRQPSIFSVRWFRIALGVGVALVLALLVGPSVSGWFGGDLPRSLFLLVPWSTDEETLRSWRAGAGQLRGRASRVPRLRPPAPPRPGERLLPAARRPMRPADGHASGDGQRVAGDASTASPAAALAAHAATFPSVRPGAASAEVVPARAGALAAPPAVYWVQVGAFLDHRNADRLAERLRGEGLRRRRRRSSRAESSTGCSSSAPTTAARPTTPSSACGDSGIPWRRPPTGPAVTGLVPLRRAVEMSHTLRQQGISVRLKQEVSSSTYRVVRVGSFATVAEAEATLATLTARGVEGVVVRER